MRIWGSVVMTHDLDIPRQKTVVMTHDLDIPRQETDSPRSAPRIIIVVIKQVIIHACGSARRIIIKHGYNDYTPAQRRRNGCIMESDSPPVRPSLRVHNPVAALPGAILLRSR